MLLQLLFKKALWSYQGERGLPGVQGTPGEVGPPGVGTEGPPVSIVASCANVILIITVKLI